MTHLHTFAACITFQPVNQQFVLSFQCHPRLTSDCKTTKGLLTIVNYKNIGHQHLELVYNKTCLRINVNSNFNIQYAAYLPNYASTIILHNHIGPLKAAEMYLWMMSVKRAQYMIMVIDRQEKENIHHAICTSGSISFQF